MGSRPFGEYPNQILTGMEKIVSVVQASMRTLEPSLERLTRAMLVANERLLAIDWDKLGAIIREFAEFAYNINAYEEAFALMLFDLGWPPPLDICLEDAQRIVELYLQDGVKCRPAVDDYICSLYTEGVLFAKFEDWRRNPILASRIHILEAVLEAHLEGKYFLSVPALLPQIEGLIVDAYGHTGWLAGGRLEKYINSIDNVEERERVARKELSINDVFKQIMIDLVLDNFCHGEPVNSPLSRHAILHGGDTKYGTGTNSLKTILLFDYFQAALAFIVIEGRKTYHKPQCHVLRRTNSAKTAFKEERLLIAQGLQPCCICLSQVT